VEGKKERIEKKKNQKNPLLLLTREGVYKSCWRGWVKVGSILNNERKKVRTDVGMWGEMGDRRISGLTVDRVLAGLPGSFAKGKKREKMNAARRVLNREREMKRKTKK